MLGLVEALIVKFKVMMMKKFNSEFLVKFFLLMTPM